MAQGLRKPGIDGGGWRLRCPGTLLHLKRTHHSDLDSCISVALSLALRFRATGQASPFAPAQIGRPNGQLAMAPAQTGRTASRRPASRCKQGAPLCASSGPLPTCVCPSATVTTMTAFNYDGGARKPGRTFDHQYAQRDSLMKCVVRRSTFNTRIRL